MNWLNDCALNWHWHGYEFEPLRKKFDRHAKYGMLMHELFYFV